MTSFQSFPFAESTTSFTVLGSSSVIDKAKFEQKADGLYLSYYLISRTNILTPGVFGSSSSDSSSVVESDSYSFTSNSIFSGSFGWT